MIIGLSDATNKSAKFLKRMTQEQVARLACIAPKCDLAHNRRGGCSLQVVSVANRALEEDSLFDEADAIRDNDIYLSNMSKSFADKAWFVKYIRPDITTIVDFGGGSGEFCQYVDRILSFRKRPMRYVVIDNNQEFAVKAEMNGFMTFSSLGDFCASRVCDPAQALLVMSSVIHEVYSYQEENGPAEDFWKEVGGCKFRQIAIRDMSMNENAYRTVPKSAVAWIYENVFMSDLPIKGVPLRQQTESFEARWGAICDPSTGRVNVKNLVHFLIKYRYVENWDREVNEDYLPVTQDRLAGIIIGMGYQLTHKESSKLEFYARQWAKDFRLNRPDDNGYRAQFLSWLKTLNTHIKWLAER